MEGRPTWTDCDETGDYVVPNVLSLRDLVFRPDNMDETVPHTKIGMWGGLAQWLASRTTDQGVPCSRPGRGTVCCGLEQVTFTHCLVLVKPRKPWTDD